MARSEWKTPFANNFRAGRGIFIEGGSNYVLIRHNTFSNIMPYDNGYKAAGKTYLEQFGPDGDSARAATWFDGGSNTPLTTTLSCMTTRTSRPARDSNFRLRIY